MLFKVHAELFRKAFPLYGSELGSTHPALPKRYYCLGINKKHQKKKKKKKKKTYRRKQIDKNIGVQCKRRLQFLKEVDVIQDFSFIFLYAKSGLFCV